jgi:hypothetical protein
MAQHKEASIGQQSRKEFVVQQFLRKGIGTAADVFLTEWRVGHDQIKRPSNRRELVDCGEDILHAKFVLLGRQASVGEVFANPGGVTIGFFHAEDG